MTPERERIADFAAFMDEVRASPGYAGQIVHVQEEPSRPAVYADPAHPLSPALRAALDGRGIRRLYSHQAEAIDRARAGENLLVVTGTASGKSLCYLARIVEALADDPDATALLLFPTKALCQDQLAGLSALLDLAGMADRLAGVYDGDTPASLRRRIRDGASVVLTNPDMLHAGIMPQHARWASFLGHLRILVLDELHVYNGMFGSNVRNLLRRFDRLCRHYGSEPQIVACSATVGNPREFAERVTGRPFGLIEQDGSPRGRRTTVFWNPPRIRGTQWRSRRSANVEAHELMASLVARGAPTIVFSKAKMTAEMIARYVRETLARTDPRLAGRIASYRGGYLAGERREIERRLFSGELVGVSATPALELGIDVGGLDASIVVGYPGTRAAYFQQAGRAGRGDRDALSILVGLDTPTNQFVMEHPEYLFGHPVERAVIDPDNPFVVTGHLRCAAHELALPDADAEAFGPHAGLVLEVLESNRKIRRIGDRWHHSAPETPQHEVSLRSCVDAIVVIQDAATGEAIGELNEYDAPSIVHEGAIYMHRGDTYRVSSLDMARGLATVRREETDYYTQPMGGTDVHHVDHCLRTKPFGAGSASWGEVTAYFRATGYEKIRFYTLDAVSTHGLDLPILALETMAFWIAPPESLLARVRAAGLDPHAGLRAIGYATRMILPLFATCDTSDFSHSVGCVNAPWSAVFVYERHPHGLGFTEAAYERLGEIVPAVLAKIRACDCAAGCPCCVGKPLRGSTVWNVERGEGSIPSKAAALAILEGWVGDGCGLDESGSDPSFVPRSDGGLDAGSRTRLEQALRRRLERMREPRIFHPVEPVVPVAYPRREDPTTLGTADVARRKVRRTVFENELRRRTAPGDASADDAEG